MYMNKPIGALPGRDYVLTRMVIQRIYCGEGQTKRPRACDRGNGWAHSAGRSMVDHDKWLQVGISVAIKATGGAFTHTPPWHKNYTDTRRVAPKWPHGRGRRSDNKQNFHIHPCPHAGQEAPDNYADAASTPLPDNNGSLPRTYEKSKRDGFKPTSPGGAYA